MGEDSRSELRLVRGAGPQSHGLGATQPGLLET